MFGAIVAGRLVCELPSIPGRADRSSDETHFVFLLENPYEIHHLTVFLTGTPFPEGYGATVHYAWPNAPNDWIALGGLTNARPSAIYKVNPPTNQAQGPAQVGIEIAPLAAVDALVQQRAASREKGAEIAAKVDVGKVAEKVVKNEREERGDSPVLAARCSLLAAHVADVQLWNYLHSFGDAPLTPQTPIPLSVFQKWYDNFTRKLGNDRGASFLDRED
ncbi:hypothetical protein A1Q1_03442 [Trichosporon asahii var. asahii CBS 2479]|uniref:Uncharacterized protein n=1 Tax=Trichosporon asahii var. asahii (strain ATCC 90039 / CBS 2479 / JCM 2466 / KCTC 7840 / NBRC 103889/ NCYC 2677 / UAMH 7654) TaxID=1186058 RepID=J4UAA9_TRIAS|nr:hypothetical protein A1Q1_03442 [Trichosporon asahii var. asahii CBS 2479]EJT47665.1 hypothetical protein A1Q1_03442 [Trichosporon asahii var. asahii CBS 2479]